MDLKKLLSHGKRQAWRWAARIALLSVAVLLTIVLAFAFQARLRLPELQPWHTAHLDGELRAGREAAAMSFEAYRRVEDSLLRQVQQLLESRELADDYVVGRYSPGSHASHLAFEKSYNRSFELVPETIRGAALLVHGLSDSPYSLHAIAEALLANGFYVLALRLPGHGTIPAALREVSWRDWLAAVEIGARHVAGRAGPALPFYTAGYSTGAPLVLLQALDALDGGGVRPPDRLLLFSPAIGISSFAVLTNVVAGLSWVPYFEKSAWLDVLPEYDPFKYNSFPVNAGTQMYHLTRELAERLAAAKAAGKLELMPRVLAFQSLIDATVSAADVVERLFIQLPPRGHELVVFDINRSDLLRDMIAAGPRIAYEQILAAPALPFRSTFIANASAGSPNVVSHVRAAGTLETQVEDMGLSWPPGVLSLSHVALPFPPDDPMYGLLPPRESGWGMPLGRLAARGEAGAMIVSLGSLARLRSNPFFAVILRRIQEIVDADLKPAR